MCEHKSRKTQEPKFTARQLHQVEAWYGGRAKWVRDTRFQHLLPSHCIFTKSPGSSIYIFKIRKQAFKKNLFKGGREGKD